MFVYCVLLISTFLFFMYDIELCQCTMCNVICTLYGNSTLEKTQIGGVIMIYLSKSPLFNIQIGSRQLEWYKINRNSANTAQSFLLGAWDSNGIDWCFLEVLCHSTDFQPILSNTCSHHFIILRCQRATAWSIMRERKLRTSYVNKDSFNPDKQRKRYNTWNCHDQFWLLSNCWIYICNYVT